MAAEKASDGGSGRSARGTLTTWKLPGRLCGRWADTAVCGRGAARGGLECTPARRPERRREGEGTKLKLTGSSLGLQGSRWPTALVLGAEPGLGGQHTAGEAATATHQTHMGRARWSRRPRAPPVLRYEGGGRHLLWPRPWWNVPGAGPVTMASLETPALAEESALKEITWRGSWEIIPKGPEFKAPGSLGLPAL